MVEPQLDTGEAPSLAGAHEPKFGEATLSGVSSTLVSQLSSAGSEMASSSRSRSPARGLIVDGRDDEEKAGNTTLQRREMDPQHQR